MNYTPLPERVRASMIGFFSIVVDGDGPVALGISSRQFKR
jgi:hypothetical protein